MRHYLRFVAVTLCALGLSGCVERRYVVYTDPPGAMVFRNGQPLGATPADDHFVYYGKYKFTIIADGYETLTVEQDIPAHIPNATVHVLGQDAQLLPAAGTIEPHLRREHME